MARRLLEALVLITLAGVGCSPAAETPDVGTGDTGRNDAAPEADASDAGDAGDINRDASPLDATDAAGPSTVTIDAARAFELVDPFVGTGGLGFGYAALTPAAQVPNGMVRLGPDTSKGTDAFPQHHFSGYHAEDTDIRWFSHTRLVGTGVGAQGHLGWRPATVPETGGTGPERPPWEDWVPMDKNSERAEPGYYSVQVTDPQVRAEMTATLRGGLQRYTPTDDSTGDSTGQSLRLVFNATSTIWENDKIRAEIEVDGDVIEGRVHHDGDFTTRSRPYTLYFSTRLSQIPSAIERWTRDSTDGGPGSVSGHRAGVTLDFDTVDDAVEVRTGLSYVDLQQARLHRRRELQDRSLQTIRDAAAARWRDKLGRIELTVPEGGVDEHVRLFYTALYNVWRMPTRLDGTDGRYRGFDGQIHTIPDDADFRFFTDLSLWDTFRTLHPLLVLIDPALQRDSLRSLIKMGEHGGYIPAWPAGLGYSGSMIGTSADVLFGGSAAKGIDGVDYEVALDLLLKTADGPTPPGAPFRGRPGIEDYLTLGYIPAGSRDGDVSIAVEYAWNDWALANLADHLGRPEAKRLRERAANWKNLYDPETGFLRPRHADGRFTEPFNPNQGAATPKGHYTEGNAWHWRFYPLYHAEQMVQTYGGPEAFRQPLTTFFEESATANGPVRALLPDHRFWPGNEHDIHAPYLFHFVDQPQQVGKWVRKIQERIYSPTPDGYPGNDDGGTMSSVYIFHALGLYPIAGGDRYLWGAPLFRRATLYLGDDSTLTIEAEGAGPEAWRVRTVTVDGTPVETPYLRHSQLQGATVEFRFADAP